MVATPLLKPARPSFPSVRDTIMLFLGASVALGVFGAITYVENSRTPLPYLESGITARWIPDTVKRYDKPINEMAKKYNIDANLIAIIVTLESGGDYKAQSEVGATGLMQLMPTTAHDIASKQLMHPVSNFDLFDPRTNIEFGTAYVAWLRDEFGTIRQGPEWTNTVELIAVGYNGGAGSANAFEKGEGLRDSQPVFYSHDAANMWRERVSKTSPTFDRWKERGGVRLLDAAAKGL